VDPYLKQMSGTRALVSGAENCPGFGHTGRRGSRGRLGEGGVDDRFRGTFGRGLFTSVYF
jgi:hypothetical protein